MPVSEGQSRRWENRFTGIVDGVGFRGFIKTWSLLELNREAWKF